MLLRDRDQQERVELVAFCACALLMGLLLGWCAGTHNAIRVVPECNYRRAD